MRISDWSSDVCSSDLIGHSLFKALKVREHQLRFDGFRVGDGIDLAFDMGDVIIDEAAEHMHDRIHFPDIGEELIAQTLSPGGTAHQRSEEHTSELQSLMRITYAVFCLKKKIQKHP